MRIIFREKLIKIFLNAKEYKLILLAYLVIPLYFPSDMYINKLKELNKKTTKLKVFCVRFPEKLS